MGTMVWSPLAKGMLGGRIRKGQQVDLGRAIIGPRTMEQLDDLLAASTSRSPTRSSTGSMRSSRPAPMLAHPTSLTTYHRPSGSTRLRRRPIEERSAA